MNRLLTFLDGLCDRWGERLNPIVVRETRQALRSRGFTYSFLGMLVLCVGESLLLVLSEGERLQRVEAGRDFFPWYLGSLLLAICFVVPLSLFQSVVSEFDGQTFEMLAITALTPRQIVFGKLTSAVVQMGAFYSAAAPFVCFTYLLQGVSAPGIVLALVIGFCCGISTCLGAMMLAAVSRQSMWQVVGLFLAVGLGMLAYGVGLRLGMAASSRPLSGGQLGDLCAGIGCFSYAFLFFALLTTSVSIAQFTPTLPRERHVERGGGSAVRSPDRALHDPVPGAASMAGELTVNGADGRSEFDPLRTPR
jgi:hypothetical protein